MIDIQTETILKKAKILETIASDSLAKKVLEIDTKYESGKKLELLIRFIRSIDQYVNKKRNIVYVGFLGHYNSGKSSTINSILQLGNSTQERETGLNPTDKAITLITHPDNSNSLILMAREGGAVPVRVSLIEREQLKSLVLCDTPGSGDPQVVNELIQDFLPICDYVLYFIPATNPIDQADIPIIKQKNERLPFLKMLFIVTRTDEFKQNENLSLDKANISQQKKDIFMGKLISRLKQILQTENIFPEDFIFIDNKSGYNIQLLKNILIDSTNGLDEQELIKMHSYKVEYYRHNLDSIYSYFLASIDEKIKQGQGYLKTASENIARFDKSVEINNEKLRLLWSKSEMNFKDTLNLETRIIVEIGEIEFKSQLQDYLPIQTEIKTIDQATEDQANGYLGKIISDLNSHFKQRIREIKYAIVENIKTNEIMTDNVDYLFPGRLDLGVPDFTVEIDLLRLNDYIRSYFEKIISLLQDSKSDLKSKLNSVKSHSGRELLIMSLQENYELGRNAIFDNFDQYFEKIQMYRSTVLTRNTKENIEKLRVGTQLDELDEEFDENYISEMKWKAAGAVYYSNEEGIRYLREKLEFHLSHLQELKISLDAINIPKPEFPNVLIKEQIDLLPLVNDLLLQKESIVTAAYQERLSICLNGHKAAYDDFQKSLLLIKQHRRRLARKLAIITGILSLLAFIGLKFFKILAPQTVTVTVILGLVTNLIGSIAGWLIGSLRTDVKKVTLVKRGQFETGERTKMLQYFNEDFWEDLSKKIDEKIPAKSTFLKVKIKEKIEPVILKINNDNQTLLNSLLTARNRLTSILSGYKNELGIFYNKFSKIFLDPEKNLRELSSITKQIKEKSIKPSFELIEDTSSNLENVKKKISNLKDL